MLSHRPIAAVVVVLLTLASCLEAAEVVELDEQNWSDYVPAGKEVDAIYGDYALRSDRLMAIVGRAVETRNANMTVKGAGGALLDLTRRDEQSDQLSCFYPHSGAYRLEGPVEWPEGLSSPDGAARIAFRAMPADGSATANADGAQIVVGYELADRVDYLTVRSLIKNATDRAQEINLVDGVRADGEFTSGHDAALNLWWCYDEFWRQAYGVQPTEDRFLVRVRDSERRPVRLHYDAPGGSEKHRVEPGSSMVLARRIFPSANTLDTQAIARELRGQELTSVSISVRDPSGPLADVRMRIRAGDKIVGAGHTDIDGKLRAQLPPSDYRCLVAAQGRPEESFEAVAPKAGGEWAFQLAGAGYVQGAITDENGEGIPCKLAFYGEGISDPDFGPDSAVHGVRNLWYTHNGSFRVELLPGRYQVLISRGTEYDAVVESIDVVAGLTTPLAARMERTVDTAGWLSAELHSHSTPSGDNTASQRGRVLNLLAEHLEFIPCTEHQRVSSYDAHLAHFGARRRVLTCPGMELTGRDVAVNHQNAFPLVLREHIQDGGGPQSDPHPEIQIARLAMWDDGAGKVVQINHPNIAQVIGDRDLDRVPDEGFRQMFRYADVIEVHPLQTIFNELTVGEGGAKDRGNTIVNWMQLLNLGYRIPGVVNTDAHWNFHGSGWLRNYVRSSSDEPAEAQLADVCRALQQGQIVMTNGPFMTVAAYSGENSAGPGEDLLAVGGDLQLTVRVQCANWLNVNRVQVFVNGRADEKLNFTRRAHGTMFGDGTVKFDHPIALRLERDAHIVVAAADEGGQLGRVFGPDQGRAMPIAVSNPIFVDIDEDGFTPNRDSLGRPLPVEQDHEPTHGHRHRSRHHP